jgi:transcriptional/translational regulatory protein YebC/TACO1
MISKRLALSASMSAEQLEEVEAFMSAIDGNDDVQNVYVGLAG